MAHEGEIATLHRPLITQPNASTRTQQCDVRTVGLGPTVPYIKQPKSTQSRHCHYNVRGTIAIIVHTKVRLRPHTASITNNTVQFEHT